MTKKIADPILTLLSLLLVSAAACASEKDGSSIASFDTPGKSVKRIRCLLTQGGRVGWSPDGHSIVFDLRSPDGWYDVWRIDADGAHRRCLTSANPEISEHNGTPAWHPSGKHIMFTAADPALGGLESVPLARYLKSPGIGINNNLWLTDADGTRFWQLTQVQPRHGVLHPHFSPDGKKLLWSEIISPRFDRMGHWAIKVADLSFAGDEPVLRNISTMRPGNLQVYETHGFSPDGSTIVFSGIASGKHYYGFEIYTMNLLTGDLAMLTNDNEWDEHAHITPDGAQIVWASTRDIPQPKDGVTLQDTLENPPRMDLWLMNVDGSGKRRLTWLNEAGAPEYLGVPDGIGLGDLDIHPDGQRIVVKMRYGRQDMNILVELTPRGDRYHN
ncbi:MAG: hypothetical protein GXY38_05100 [Planctomycetes bacterium]|jgi:Tol biopolymer transport system component|nr:hypothetical protein [Planctomycetota bacterium]